MSFLPEDYKAPDSSNYLKFKDGENTIRVLSSAIIGYEYWTENNKPVRSREPFQGIPEDIRREKDGTPTRIKHFWAFVVWNYEAEKVQIAEITQSTIRKDIKALVDNKKWGDPKGYDITITRTGEGLDTDYAVMPNPHSSLDPVIKAAYEQREINLEALYENGDPFQNS